MLISYFEKLSTWICRFLSAVNVYLSSLLQEEIIWWEALIGGEFLSQTIIYIKLEKSAL